MTNFEHTKDMELQGKAVESGQRYVREMWPGTEDLEKKANLQNACAAGYIKGYRDRQSEEKGTV